MLCHILTKAPKAHKDCHVDGSPLHGDGAGRIIARRQVAVDGGWGGFVQIRAPTAYLSRSI